MNSSRRAYSLVELLIVLGCLGILILPVWEMFRHGTKSSLRGVLQAETTLAARGIIRLIADDLKNACFEELPRTMECDIRKLVGESGLFPNKEYSFLAFSRPAQWEDVLCPDGFSATGRAFTKVSRITYSTDRPPGSSLLRLIRTERFPPGTPEAASDPDGRSRVISHRVNYFAIDLVVFPGQADKEGLGFFQITLQLADSLDPRRLPPGVGAAKFQGPAPDLILADFSELVYPEQPNHLFHPGWFNRNWHSGIQGP